MWTKIARYQNMRYDNIFMKCHHQIEIVIQITFLISNMVDFRLFIWKIKVYWYAKDIDMFNKYIDCHEIGCIFREIIDDPKYYCITYDCKYNYFYFN